MSNRSRLRSWKKQKQKQKQKRKVLMLSTLVLCVVAVVGFFVFQSVQREKNRLLEASAMTDTINQMAETMKSAMPSNTPAPIATPSPTPTSTPTPSPTPIPYDYAQPVPESIEIDSTYFADAAFIGDSRTQGFFLYSGVEGAMNLAGKGLTVKTAFTSEIVKDSAGKKTTVMGALADKQYGKIYVMLGVNELGWASESLFIENYEILLDAIKETQPSAVIYIQSIIPVSQIKSNKDSVYNNTNIQKFTELIKQMVIEKEVYYINIAEALVDDSGALCSEASTDGVHLNRTYCEKWYAYLLTHTVKRSNE